MASASRIMASSSAEKEWDKGLEGNNKSILVYRLYVRSFMLDITYTDCSSILRDSASLVLKDEGFDLPSPQAKFARLCGEKLHLWLSGSNNTVQIVSFANDLVSSLQTCFAESSKSRAVGNYYKLRSSFEFQDMWAAFFRKSIDVKASPIFYQFITDSIMEVLIKHHFLIHMPSSKHAVSSL